MPTFVCKDMGMDCPFTASAPTEAELMKKIAEHAKVVHKIDPVPADMMAKIKKVIKKQPAFLLRLCRPRT
jgi:predicted small metal-binding protein